MRLLTKWATADVPVRVRSRVVAVPVERTRVRPVVHVSTRDDHRSRVPLSPYIYELLIFLFAADIIVGFRISKGRELPACMCYGSFAGSSGGYKSPGPP